MGDSKNERYSGACVERLWLLNHQKVHAVRTSKLRGERFRTADAHEGSALKSSAITTVTTVHEHGP